MLQCLILMQNGLVGLQHIDGAIVTLADGSDSDLTMLGLLNGLSNDTLLDTSFTNK